jgi:hypothetical protein
LITAGLMSIIYLLSAATVFFGTTEMKGSF